MVDAGLGAESMAAEMKKLNIDPKEVTALLLTHTDSDHIGGVALFSNAKIYMHKDEEQMIDGRNGKFPFIRFHWKYGPYNLVSDNDTLLLEGLRVKVIHTPGHTPGSCCFLINGSDLAVGDNLAIHNGVISTFNDFFNMDTRQQAAALAEIPELHTAKYILSAHYGILRH
jgi:glyoxylase-like metal-dependent hydrolase (beta-lactamase superfamily II)